MICAVSSRPRHNLTSAASPKSCASAWSLTLATHLINPCVLSSRWRTRRLRGTDRQFPETGVLHGALLSVRRSNLERGPSGLGCGLGDLGRGLDDLGRLGRERGAHVVEHRKWRRGDKLVRAQITGSLRDVRYRGLLLVGNSHGCWGINLGDVARRGCWVCCAVCIDAAPESRKAEPLCH